MQIKCLFKKNLISLKDFHLNRNKVAIYHHNGGLGDIIMLRMILQSFKYYLGSEIYLTLSCNKNYFDMVKDHPALDELIDVNYFNKNNYGQVYTTFKKNHVDIPPKSKHKSDYWANSKCGIHLISHDPCFKISQREIIKVKETINTNKPIVLFVPLTNNGSEKNLSKETIILTIKELQNRGFFVLGLYQESKNALNYLGVNPGYDQVILTDNLNLWKSVVAAVDYVITIDTAVFHFAGCICKPMVGIFSWTDGKVYGKYFNFELVQKHFDNEKDWCGPCGNWCICPKDKISNKLPCVHLTSYENIMDAFDRLTSKRISLKLV